MVADRLGRGVDGVLLQRQAGRLAIDDDDPAADLTPEGNIAFGERGGSVRTGGVDGPRELRRLVDERDSEGVVAVDGLGAP